MTIAIESLQLVKRYPGNYDMHLFPKASLFTLRELAYFSSKMAKVQK